MSAHHNTCPECDEIRSMLSEAMAILRDAVPILAGNPTPVAERARVQALAELFLHNIRHEPDGGKIAPRPENQPKHS